MFTSFRQYIACIREQDPAASGGINILLNYAGHGQPEVAS